MKGIVKASRRRIVAYVIDMLLIGFLCAALVIAIPWEYVGIIVFFVLLVPHLLLRDCIFGNASPGKLIMGLRVVDINGKVPSPKMLIRRNLLMLRTGYKIYGFSRVGIPFCKDNVGLSYVAGDTDYFHTWETKVTETMVVYRKTGERAIRYRK